MYETADGRFVSFGAIDPKAQAELLERLGLSGQVPVAADRSEWPTIKTAVAEAVRKRTRLEWSQILEGTDACFAPVLEPDEAATHPHNQVRGLFVEIDGVVQPAPAPRFSRTEPEIAGPPPRPGQHTDEALADWGIPAAEIARLRAAGAVA